MGILQEFLEQQLKQETKRELFSRLKVKPTKEKVKHHKVKAMEIIEYKDLKRRIGRF